MIETLLPLLFLFYGINTPTEPKSIDIIVPTIMEMQEYSKPIAYDSIGRRLWPGPCTVLKNHCLIAVKMAQQQNINPFLWVGLVLVESQGNQYSIGDLGEVGYSQLMYHHVRGLTTEQKFDPEINMRIGTKYLRESLNYHNQKVFRALGGYNAGIQNSYYDKNYSILVLKKAAYVTRIQEAHTNLQRLIVRK